MYTLKSIARRGTMLGAATSLLVAAVLPAAAVLADGLNPLTERSLLLSSSAPGFQNTDGSGNPTYAPPGSGPNGEKTGETFTFNVSSDSSSGNAIKAITLQYCTSAAGVCQAPGNNDGDARDDLPAARETNAVAHPQGQSDLDVVGSWTNGSGAGQFEVLVNGVAADTGNWTMTTENVEDTAHSGNLTGKKNFIILRNTATGATPAVGDTVEVVFKASGTNYITNPGSGSFFVKINTYSDGTADQQLPDTNANIIDGGVTVANVMTDSIHITTKVLETMAFSVGTKNRDTKAINCVFVDAQTTPDCEGSGSVHGTCDPVQQVSNNRLNLGNPNAEYSLETGKAWDVHSYWRLSSNSSGGATVYYSGNTLANTVGDEIADMPAEAVSTPGTEQFGLGFVDAGLDTFDPVFSNGVDGLVETQPTRYKKPTSFPFRTLSTQTTGAFDLGSLPAQPLSGPYDEATGTLDNGNGAPGTAKFKFVKTSLTVPEPIAQQNDQVISCSTAKMRYVANIGADTPAGVYTTKINYLAAPQY